MLFNHWKQIEEYYKSSTINPSEEALLQHFGGSLDYKDTAHLNSIDIDYLNRRTSQNTIDIWHLSGKSPQEFSQTQLINFEQHSKSIYTSFIGYLTQFTRLFYSSLQLYLSNQPDLLLGDVNNLIQTILQIIQELQRQHVEPNCNLHIDLECPFKYNTKPRHEANSDESGDDLDVDPKFEYNEPVMSPAIKSEENKSVKYSFSKPKVPPAGSTDEEKVNSSKGKSYDLDKEGGMKRILRALLMSISKSYHHYGLELNGTNLKSYELSTSIPRCSIEYSPLCKIYNTINRMQDSKCAEDEGLITISFHKYSDILSLYLFCRDSDGKVHGQRIFLNEIMTVLVQLFKDQVIRKETESLLDKIQLKEDKDFIKFNDFLKPKKEDVLQQDNDSIFSKLNEFIFEYNHVRDIPQQISGNAMTRCFRENDMDFTDYKDLRVNLKRYGIPAGAVRKLWRFLNPDEVKEGEQDDENEVFVPLGTYTYITTEFEDILFEDVADDDIDFGFCEDLPVFEDEGIFFEDNDDVSIDLEIGGNLTVPSDWSDGDE